VSTTICKTINPHHIIITEGQKNQNEPK
jgi:hypothetical protein